MWIMPSRILDLFPNWRGSYGSPTNCSNVEYGPYLSALVYLEGKNDRKFDDCKHTKEKLKSFFLKYFNPLGRHNRLSCAEFSCFLLSFSTSN